MTRKKIIQYSLLIAFLVVLPFFLKSYYVYVVNLIYTYIILALGLNILMGATGLFGLCHVTFFGIGIYTYALLRIHFGIPFYIGILAGAVLSAVIGYLIAIPAIRMRDIYLALATLSFGESMQWVFNNWDAVTKGPNGIQIPAANIGSYKLMTDETIYYLVFVVTALMFILTRNIMSSKVGRAFISIRESETAAKAMGIDVNRYKAFSFAISAFYAGIAGGLTGVLVPFIHPSTLGMMHTILILTMLVVGGMGTIGGSIVGACTLGIIPELLREFVFLQEIIYGAALMLFLIFMPEGIFGRFTRIMVTLRRKESRKES
jgi:branched-chain amino acid transport system permease protein